MKNTVDFFSTRPAAEPSPLRISDEAEACAAVLMACLRANELDSDEENAAFYTTIRSRNIFKGYDAAALVETAGRYFGQAGSPERLIDAAIGAIRDQTRLPLFYHCLDVILADGVVTPREHKVFQYLKGRFKVDDETAWKALELLVVKNQL
ncbi:MAG: TerB family tellurite resistance protein [Saprospiraceae bacterium]|nr:TerB family tellurite resistance protein [Saprospiraceae bacterium]